MRIAVVGMTLVAVMGFASDRSYGQPNPFQQQQPRRTLDNLLGEPAEKAPLDPPAKEAVAGVDLLAVPPEAEVAEAIILIRDVYADEYKAEPGVLIKTLKSAAFQTDDAVRKFALLQEAEKAAVWSGDPSQAFELLEKRGSLFEIDVQQSSIALIKKFTKPTGETTKKLVERLLQLSRTALEADQLPFAKEAVELGVFHARALATEERVKKAKGQGEALRNEATALQKDITQRIQLFGDYEKALATLKKPGAGACEREHDVVGRYICLGRGDWETGLTYLAKGEAGPLQVAASKEIEMSQKAGAKKLPTEVLAVAGDWWKLSEKPVRAKPPEDEAIDDEPAKKKPVEKESSLSGSDLLRIREHAASLYAEALPGLLDPIDRALATKRRVGPEGPGPKKPTNSLGMELVEIPKGKFLMGEGSRAVGVILTKPFLLGKTEVTQGQFKKVMDLEPWVNRNEVQIGEDNAASYVDWNDATAFCQRLTDTDHKNGKLPAGESYRLPTEAQWEYACRAGTQTAWSFGNDTNQMDDYGWFNGNTRNVGQGYAHKVGMKKHNPAGLFDMHGNVREWCSDWYGSGLSGGIDPAGPGGGSHRVGRYSSWWDSPSTCRSASRNGLDPSDRNSHLGFRVARSQSAQ